jgi:hypothetical protein
MIQSYSHRIKPDSKYEVRLDVSFIHNSKLSVSTVKTNLW